MILPATVKRRCAIYTRKSHEEGLDQEFNSLDAQRESAENYIASQKHEGWERLDTVYNDGGFTGANTERPALARLMRDIEAGSIDVVLVYKVDRLSRSLMDFVTLLQVFDRHGVAFVSVTQQFNTATPMGRLVLNILICFAQFERENIAERIRDKMAASRRRGKWVGGSPPFGYDVDYNAGKLVVNTAEADTVRWIFDRMALVHSAGLVIQELNGRGVGTKSWTSKKGKVHPGNRWNRGNIYKLLNNHTYLGVCHYHGIDYPGEHAAIITKEQWDAVHAVLSENHVARGNRERAKVPGFLKGLCHCAACKTAMTMTWTRGKNDGRYRYYRCSGAQKNGADSCSVGSVPAGPLEAAVLAQIRSLLRSPGLMVAASIAAQAAAEVAGDVIDHAAVLAALRDLDHVWEELFPAEQARVAAELIESVEVGADHTDLRLRPDAIAFLAAEARGAGAPDSTAHGPTISLPIQAARRSGRTTLVAAPSDDALPAVHDDSDVPAEDSINVAIARAFRWLDDLTTGRAASVAVLAEREHVDQSYVRRLLRLTLLAPPVIEQLLSHQFPGASLNQLIRHKAPQEWDLQAQAVSGMEPKPPTLTP